MLQSLKMAIADINLQISSSAEHCQSHVFLNERGGTSRQDDLSIVPSPFCAPGSEQQDPLSIRDAERRSFESNEDRLIKDQSAEFVPRLTDENDAFFRG